MERNSLPKSLITPREAVELHWHSTSETYTRARDILRAYTATRKNWNEPGDTVFAIACIWNAGRIQGIREERARKNRRRPDLLPGLSYEGIVSTDDGRRLPVYGHASFINTREGWQLYCECRKSGDMSLYKNAKHAWEVLQK